MYGGPFTHEVDAIRDERNRAAVMGKKPDFDKLFKDVELSDGAKEVIEDIKRPIEEQVFVPHDYSHDPVSNVKPKEVEEVDEKETSPKGTSKEEPSKGDKGEKKDSSRKDSSSVGSLDKILEGLGK